MIIRAQEEQDGFFSGELPDSTLWMFEETCPNLIDGKYPRGPFQKPMITYSPNKGYFLTATAEGSLPETTSTFPVISEISLADLRKHGIGLRMRRTPVLPGK